MSRLIVKNLPKNIKEERMHELFGEMGQITDLKLKYTKHGVFRRFAFVGYKTQTEAQRALKHFNKTFIDTSKIDVDICKDFGDDTAPRPWSKYSKKSSAFQKRAERREHRKRVLVGDDKTEKMEDNAERKSKKTKNALLDELESDSGFQEFLEAHKSRSTKHTWSNDEQLSLSQVKSEEPSAKGKVSFKDSFETSSDDGNDDTDNKTEFDEEADMDVDEYKTGSTEASNVALSDMDYLKKKITSKNDSTLSEQEKLVKTKKGNKKETILESERNDPSKEKKKSDKSETNNNEIPSMQDFERKSEFTIKLRGLPFHAKKKDITEFLSPLKVIEIRMPKDSKNRPSGRAYVDLLSKKDLKEALSRHKDYMKGRYIEVFEDKRKAEVEKSECESEPPWIKNATELAENRDLAISETGRLYLRNLSYTCTEEDLSELFSKYGPTTEVFMPIDKHSSQPMGFAFITFMMPEHAVQAFNELDGHVFQGRLLHILPAKPKKNSDAGEVIDQEHQSSFKKKQKANVLSLKNKDHNWNTLFLGVNAVAEIMADKYSSSKGDILDVQSKGDLALRVALGETQIVAETREFLTKHGVKLDAFGSAEAKRSKTVIIVKNLQHGTAPGELQQLFSPFGHLGKIILPPSGVTALVEFLKLSSAAKAFEKIAYTKFKNVPLYLEWAPADVFNSEQPSKESEEQSGNEKEIKDNKNESGSDSDEEPESDGHVVFVKNLNFDSNEDSLKQLFSDVGKVKNVTIAKKKDSRNKGSLLSMGYGFVQFRTKKDALNAVKELQNYELDEHKLQLKLSNKKQLQKTVRRKSSSDTKQKSSKILVRNVPFEATKKELKELFGTFGELKTVRLPKKLSGTGPHRGFAFIDFLTKQDAKRAFRSLCTSTHLYGRRLVLEWAEDNESIEELRKKTADYFHDPKKQKTKTKNFEDEIQEQ